MYPTPRQLIEYHQEFILSQLTLRQQRKLAQGIQCMTLHQIYPVDLAPYSLSTQAIAHCNRRLQVCAKDGRVSGVQKEILHFVNMWAKHARVPWKLSLFDVSGCPNRISYHAFEEDSVNSIQARLLYEPAIHESFDHGAHLSVKMQKIDYAKDIDLATLSFDAYIQAQKSKIRSRVDGKTALSHHLLDMFSPDLLVKLPQKVRPDFELLLNYVIDH